MPFFSCIPSGRRRTVERRTIEPEDVRNARVNRVVHVMHCVKSSSDPPNGLVGLPREWEKVMKVLVDDNKSEKTRRHVLKKLKKFPKPTQEKEVVIFKEGRKADLGKKELMAALETFCDKGSPEDRYEILNKIGDGTFGEVYHARDKQTQEDVALKQCSPEFVDTACNFYMNEVIVLSFFNHQNIIQTSACYLAAALQAKEIRAWQNTKVPYVVLELMDCSLGELLDYIYEEDVFTEAVVAYLMHGILSGVSYLHKNGLCHRDLKSDNILLTVEGGVKVADFGLSARFASPEDEFKATCGTTLWMAPEMCRLDRRVRAAEDTNIDELYYTYKVDIWSLGIVLIELLDGKPPHIDLWIANQRLKIKEKIVHDPPSQPKREVSPGMRWVLDAMLRKDPSKRVECSQILNGAIFQLMATSEDLAVHVRSMLESFA